MKWVMTEQSAYAAYVSPDDRKSVLFGYYNSHSLAMESVAGKSWYGSNGTVNRNPVELITFTNENGESWTFPKTAAVEIKTESPEQYKARMVRLRESALSKLTPDEKKALSL